MIPATNEQFHPTSESDRVAPTGLRMTSGETEAAPDMRALTALLLRELDVREVVALSYLPNEARWLYLIATPMAWAWPKFVIGTTDGLNTSPEIIFECGAEWAARDEWHKLNSGEHA